MLTSNLLLYQLSVSIDVPGEEAYHFQPRLFGKVYMAYTLLI